MRHWFAAAIVLVLLPWTAPRADEPARASRQMVAAAEPLAARAGLDVLRAGGNALDAAVATQMVLTLVEPQSSGIGGGAFLVYFNAATQQTTVWDGRETAPAAAGTTLFLDQDGKPMDYMARALGGRAVGVPGTLRMLELAHRRLGHAAWKSLFTAAIDMAENGFEVPPRLAASIASDAVNLRRQDAARSYFFHADGSPLHRGELLANPALATTLRQIANEGADAFYHGAISTDIATAVRADPNPGLLTADDLAAYQARGRAPVCGGYRGRTVCGVGPPSSGSISVLETLGMASHFPLPSMAPDGPDAIQIFTEALRLAYADRERYIGDPDFVSVPVRGLLDPAYLAGRAEAIRIDHAMPVALPGNPRGEAPVPQASPPSQPEHGTSQICIIDAEGNAVSMTTTVQDPFGSRLLVRGFILNDELTDFSAQPAIDGKEVANRVEPGKRPRSSMAPTLVFGADGKLQLSIGSQGGGRIIGFVSLGLIRILDWGFSPQQAADAPRIQYYRDAVELERGTPAAALAPALEDRGQTVRIIPIDSGLQAIRIGPKGLEGGADPRRDGVALGD